MFLLARNVQLGECITRLPETPADEPLEQPDWQKRLETIPKRLSEALNGESLEFYKDTRRWRRRIRYYEKVCTEYTFFSQLTAGVASFRFYSNFVRFSLFFHDSFYIFLNLWYN
jgi:hypothetical protein